MEFNKILHLLGTELQVERKLETGFRDGSRKRRGGTGGRVEGQENGAGGGGVGGGGARGG